jgi:outer membrane protein OmpA-like peptidoglycan-associated protein
MVFNDNGMITAQTGYGMGLTNNIKNSMIYSWGLYVNMNRKKRKAGKDMSAQIIPVNNCGVATVDTDCDGIVDAIDKCPTVPGLPSNNGCPVSDRDGDGVVDQQDKCPDVAGSVSNEGCPITPIDDRDKDGLADNIDKCPDQVGPASNNGCPIEDRDKDGILDDKDNCPDQAGPLTNMGCPSYNPQGGMNGGRMGNVSEYGGAYGQGMKTVLGDTVKYIIYFDFDKFNLTDNSYKLLFDVIENLKVNDNLKVQLVGHTDLEGDENYNLKLSENRIKTSKNYLMSYGISSDRILTSYYGKSKPEIPLFDKMLAWKNRRVEIFLLKK